jgi:surface protein
MSESLVLESDEPITFVGAYVKLVGTIQIDQTPDNLPGAIWTLSGPQDEIGTGDTILVDMPVGDYTLIWSDVSGFDTPLSEVQSLTTSSTLVFRGAYLEPRTIVIDQAPDDLLGAGWTLTGPQNETGTGDATLTDMPPGVYTLTWNDLAGYDKLSNATQTLEVDGVVRFWGVYYTDDAFVTTWNTSLDIHGTRIDLGLAGSVDATIYWGDGSISTVSAAGPHSHTYESNGIFTVVVTGSATEFHSDGYIRSLVSVDKWGRLGFTDLSYAFDNAQNLISVPMHSNGLEAVTNMRGLFYNARLIDVDIGGWNTSSVTNMSHMFCQAVSFNQDVGGWGTSNVNNMSDMFSSATSFNQDIGGWDTSNVTNMSQMFSAAYYFNQDIGDWDISNVTNLSEMFSGTSSFNQDIGGWDTSNVIDMEAMFFIARVFNQDIGGWDTSRVTDMDRMFMMAPDFNQDLSGWCVKLIPRLPVGFDTDAESWVLPRPIWGTCP